MEPADEDQRQVPPSHLGAECLLLGWLRVQILRPLTWTPAHPPCWSALHGDRDVFDWAAGGGSMEAVAELSHNYKLLSGGDSGSMSFLSFKTIARYWAVLSHWW